MLAKMNRQKVVVGSKQLRKALDRGTVQFVVLARNADPAITEPIEAICRQKDVPFTWVPNKQELGKACGIDVGAAAAAAVESSDSTGFAPGIYPLTHEGQNSRQEK